MYVPRKHTLKEFVKKLRANLRFLIMGIVCLSILGVLLYPKISAYFTNLRTKSVHKFVTTSLKTPIESYMLHTGGYPEELKMLHRESKPGRSFGGPYTYKSLIDPWGNPYQYQFPAVRNEGGSYDLWSMGPDGQSGTPDDIGNWQPAP